MHFDGLCLAAKALLLMRQGMSRKHQQASSQSTIYASIISDRYFAILVYSQGYFGLKVNRSPSMDLAEHLASKWRHSLSAQLVLHSPRFSLEAQGRSLLDPRRGFPTDDLLMLRTLRPCPCLRNKPLELQFH